MKILVPYISHNNWNPGDQIVPGGIEKFIDTFFKYSGHDCVGIPISLDERRDWRKVVDKILQKAIEVEPDLILNNYNSGSTGITLKKALPEVPMMWISHHTAGFMSSLGAVDSMQKFMANKGTLFMVSAHQHKDWDSLSRRICGSPLNLNGGFIAPSFVDRDYVSPETDTWWDCCTVGRAEPPPEKDPFLLHRRLATNIKMRTCVMTNTILNSYFNDNVERWKVENGKTTLTNLSHEHVMANMRDSKSFLVTWPGETFGIIALEALSNGCPVILNSKNDSHASEIIAAEPWFYRKVPHNDPGHSTEEAIKAFSKYTQDQRIEISEKTRDKFNKEAWILGINNAIDKTFDFHNKKSGLEYFF